MNRVQTLKHEMHRIIYITDFANFKNLNKIFITFFDVFWYFENLINNEML